MIEKITPWIPLMIAAGYFLFLVALWQRTMVNMKSPAEQAPETDTP